MKLIELCKSRVIPWDSVVHGTWLCPWQALRCLHFSIRRHKADGKALLSPDKNGCLEEILLCLHQVFRVLHSKCEEFLEEFINRLNRPRIWRANDSNICKLHVFFMLKAIVVLGTACTVRSGALRRPHHGPPGCTPRFVCFHDHGSSVDHGGTTSGGIVAECFACALLKTLRESDSLMAPFPKFFWCFFFLRRNSIWIVHLGPS